MVQVSHPQRTDCSSQSYSPICLDSEVPGDPWLVGPYLKHRGRLGPTCPDLICLALRSPEKGKNQTAREGQRSESWSRKGGLVFPTCLPTPLTPTAMVHQAEQKGRGWLQAGQAQYTAHGLDKLGQASHRPHRGCCPKSPPGTCGQCWASSQSENSGLQMPASNPAMTPML